MTRSLSLMIFLAACAVHPPPAAPQGQRPLTATLVASKATWFASDNRMPNPDIVETGRRSGGEVRDFDGKLVVRNVSGAPVTLHFPSTYACSTTLSAIDGTVEPTMQSACSRDDVEGPHDVTIAAGASVELPLGSLRVPVDDQHDYFLDVVLAAGDPALRVAGSLRLQIATMAAY